MPLMQRFGNSGPKIDSRIISLFGGLCFFLSTLEYLIPKPLPFIRLGLANFPLLLALDILPFSSFLFLVGLKVLGQALISGTLFSYVFLFSLGGTAVSSLLMYAIRRIAGKEKMSLIGVSTAGALAFNGVQLVLAWCFVFGESIRYAASPILALGIVTGSLLGMLSEYFIKRSVWYERILDPQNEDLAKKPSHKDTEVQRTNINGNPGFPNSAQPFAAMFRSNELALAGLCMIPALLLNPDTSTRVIQFLFFFFLARLSGKKIKLLPVVLIMAGIVFFNLLVPYGELLFSIGFLKITRGALFAGLRRAVTLEGLVMLSRFCIRRDLNLPGFFGEITGESFRLFSRLTEERLLFNRLNWVARLDGILLAGVEALPEKTVPIEKKGGAVFWPRLILAVIVVLAWLPFLFSIVFGQSGIG